MNCIAIDDEPRALSVIQSYAERIPFMHLSGQFRSCLGALEFLSKQSVDLIFLDINMPDLTGMEFLRSLTNPPMIIFTTAYPEYAIKGYEWETVGYLLKPIEFSKFLKALNKAASLYKLKSQSAPKGNTNVRDDLILVKSGTQTHRLLLKDILYVEASGNHVYFYTLQKKVISATSLSEVENRLPSGSFLRIHKSFIISISHLEVIERHQVKIANKTLPIGKTYRQSILKKFNL